MSVAHRDGRRLFNREALAWAMPAPRSPHAWLLLAALGLLVGLAPAATAQGQEDMPPIVPQDLSADPSFQNVTADTEEMSFSVTLVAIEPGFTGSFTVDLDIQDRKVATIEEFWSPGTETMTVRSDEDADEGPGTWAPEVGMHPFNLTVEASGESFPLDFQLPIGPDISLYPRDAEEPDPPAPVELDPPSPEPGDEVTFAVNVSNQGSWDTPDGTPIPVTISLDDETLGQATVQDLAAGNQTTLTFEDAWTAEVGHHNLDVEVDRGAIEEISDRNNENNYTFDVVEPGLAVAELDAEPDPAEPGEPVTLTATIVNEDDEPVDASTTAFYQGDERVAETDTDALDPDQRTTVTAQAELAAGRQTITAVANPQNESVPPSDDPSTATVELLVGPELGIEDVQASPDHPVEGEPVTIEGTLANAGTAHEGNVSIAVYDQEREAWLAWTNVTEAPAASQTPFSIELTPDTGDYGLYVMLDPSEEANDADSDNNQAVVTFTVREHVPDLSIATLGFQEDLRPGDQAAAQVRVINEGEAEVSDLVARFTLDGSPLGSDVDLDPMGPGDVATADSRAWEAEPGDHELAVQIGSPHDFAAGSPLASETTTFTVTETKTNLTVDQLATEPADPSPGDEVRLTVQITNAGEAPASGFDVLYRVDDQRIGMERIEELPPGESRTLESPAWTLAEDASSAQVLVEGASSEGGQPGAAIDLQAQADAPTPGLAALLAATALAGLAHRARRKR